MTITSTGQQVAQLYSLPGLLHIEFHLIIHELFSRIVPTMMSNKSLNDFAKFQIRRRL
jgi:hypothetical protein